jgi:hypothetical protein
MVVRSVTAVRTGLAIFFFVCAAGIAALFYFVPAPPLLHDTASVGRMPVAGTADVDLAAGGYGLYFGLLNRPTGKEMHVPKLSITIVPPDGIPDPDFVEVSMRPSVYVDGFNTVQVARITVLTAGTYHVEVESPEENTGSFSIGELPATVDAVHNLARGAPAILGCLGLSVLMAVLALSASRRRTA